MASDAARTGESKISHKSLHFPVSGRGRRGAGRFGRGFVFGTAPLCSLHGASSVSRFLPRMNVGEGFPKLFWRRRMLLRDDRQHKPRLFLAAAAARCCGASTRSSRCCSGRLLLCEERCLRSRRCSRLLLFQEPSFSRAALHAVHGAFGVACLVFPEPDSFRLHLV